MDEGTVANWERHKRFLIINTSHSWEGNSNAELTNTKNADQTNSVSGVILSLQSMPIVLLDRIRPTAIYTSKWMWKGCCIQGFDCSVSARWPCRCNNNKCFVLCKPPCTCFYDKGISWRLPRCTFIDFIGAIGIK